jgi:hypothetical protein
MSDELKQQARTRTLSDDEIGAIYRQTFPRGPYLITADVHKFARALLDAWGARMAVPAGWKLVPIEPTEDMRHACYEEYQRSGATYTSICRAMIAAAPSPTKEQSCGS